MAKITFQGIGIQNLGPFRERQYLDLRSTAVKPIVLVRALNGSGKTTLLTSLQVVLYGARLFVGAKSSDYEQLIRSLQRSDSLGNSRVDLDLRIEAHGGTEELTVTRQWVVTKSKFLEQLAVHRDGVHDAELSDDWSEYIDGILPAELVQLFLFDGEKIEALANPNTLPDMLRRATEAFLGIGGIDALAKDLVAVERRTLLRSKDDSQEHTEAQAELKGLEDQRDQLTLQLGQLAQMEGAARQAFDTTQKDLDRFTARAEREGLSSFEKAGELRAEEQLARLRVNEAEADVRDALADPWSALAGLDGLWAQYASLWHKEQDTRTAKHLLGEIGKRDTRVLKAVAPFLPELALQKLESVFAEDSTRYQESAQRPIYLDDSDPPDFSQSKIRAAKVRLESARSYLEKCKAKLFVCEKKLASIPKGEQVADLLQRMAELSSSRADAKAKLDQVVSQRTEIARSLSHIEIRIRTTTERLGKDFRGQAHDAKAMEASQRARAVLSVYKDRLLASKAKWLAEMITSEFASLMRKRKLVDRVNVDPSTYAVTIVAPDGHELPMGRLSAGERQLLAIAVLSALIRERKGQFPVAVDTPLARLDKKHRRALIQRFFSKISHQVMVLSTDEEVDGEIMGEMNRYTAKAYELDYSDHTRSTTADLLELMTA